MRKSTGGYPKGWKKIARAAIERAGNKCERCGRPHEQSRGRGLNVHHLDWDRSNKESWDHAVLCARCHFFVQAKAQLQQTWMVSNESWLQPHIDGYCQWIVDKINLALSSDTK